MLKVGITGSLGVGKTTVCKIFETLSVPVFYADIESKNILFNDGDIRGKMIKEFGDDIIERKTNTINKVMLSEIIFSNTKKRKFVNELLHPKVINAYKQWLNDKKELPYIIKEAAIFFESGSAKEMDFMIGVDCEVDLLKQRLKTYRSMSEESINKIINTQIKNSEKMQLCDGVISNGYNKELLPQVLQFHAQFKVNF